LVKIIYQKGGMKMRINVEAVLQLIQEKFRNNKTWFAETIGLSDAYLNGILNNNKPADSKKACACIIQYCEQNSLDYKQYIFLP
jgi:hypothetical protein